MSHFNRLSDAETERLDMLAEEAAEMIQAVSKIKRHGYHSYNPDDRRAPDNRRQLEKELSDLLGVWTAMRDEGDVHDPSIQDTRQAWQKKLRYAHHQDNPHA